MTADEPDSGLDAPTLDVPVVPERHDRTVIAAVVAAIVLLGAMGAFLWFGTGDVAAVGTVVVRPAGLSASAPAPPTPSASPVVTVPARTTPRRPNVTSRSTSSTTTTSSTSGNNGGGNGQNNGGDNNGNNGDNNGNGNGGNGGNGDLFPDGF